MKIKDIVKAFDQSEYLQGIVLRLFVITLMAVFVYMTAQRFIVHTECLILLPTYTQVIYTHNNMRFNTIRYGISSYTDSVKIVLKNELDPWGEPYILEFYVRGE